MVAPKLGIRTVDIDGNMDQYLPDFQNLDLSAVFCAAGAVVVKYPVNGTNFDLLGEDVELAVTLNGVEVPQLRCLVESVDGNDVDEASDGSVWTFTARTLLGVFDQGIVYPLGWPHALNPTFDFTTATPGQIVKVFVDASQGRGALFLMDYDFTAALDSNGQPWSVNIASIGFNVGSKITEVIQVLVDNGYVEVATHGRTLSLYNPGTLGTDRSTGATPLRFQSGRDMSESPRKVSTRDIATTLLVNGANSSYAEVNSDAGTLLKWGRREGYFSASMTDQAAVLSYIATNKLAVTNVPLQEVTHGLVFEENDNPRPITNFTTGDWALSDVGHGWERFRIRQWTLSVDNNGMTTGGVTLNDLIAERIDKLNTKLNNLQGGVTSPGASTPKDTGKVPVAPTGVTLTTDYYVDHDQSRAFITVNWTAPVANTDSTVLEDLSYYLARWRYVGDSNWQATTRVEPTVTQTYFAGIFTNTSVEAQVQAVNQYNRGSAWSVSGVVTTARDLVAPNKPAPPVVTSNVGTLRVVWNGLDSAGAAQVADFDGVEVHVGTTPTFTPDATTLKDYLKGRSTRTTTITGLAYGTDWYVRLIAVDTSVNKSVPSDSNSTSHAVLNQVVGTEIGTGQVGLGQVAFSDVGNLVDDGTFENIAVRVNRQAQMTGTHFAFDNTTSSNGGWSIRHDSWAGGDTSEAIMLQGSLPVKPGERVFGAADYRATSDVPASPTFSYLSLVILWRDVNGVYLDSTGAASPTYLGVLADNWWSVADNTWHARVTGVSKVAPPNVATMEIWLHTVHRTAGTIWIDAVEVRRQIDTLMIQQAAITTALIADLAVNNAKIADLSVGKLTTGTLGADIVVGARIKTANTGARVELSSSGLLAYNSGGIQTGLISAADGSISMAGTFVTGYSGGRIEINPAGLPTIRIYSGAGTEYGFVNGFTLSGTDVGVGFNSSSFSGNSTQLGSRFVAWPGSAALEVVRSDNQQTSGGWLQAYPDSLQGGFNLLGVAGGNFWMGANQLSLAANSNNKATLSLSNTEVLLGFTQGASTENVWYLASGVTRHYGKWENNAGVAGATQGLYTGRVNIGSGFSGLSVTYGATMSSAMSPLATVSHSNYDNTTGTSTISPIWGISAGSGGTTGFTVGYDKGLAVAVQFWVFRG